MNEKPEITQARSNINALLTQAEVAALEQILAEELEVRIEQLTPEAQLKADLGADSLDLVSIVMRVEERFNVTVTDEQAEGVQTVEDLCATLAKVLGRAPE
ncbi:MAG: acyl carrier protein [Verrucomicrobia bacterium]|nr:acyl carrier protein [Verrucomicrobiota bacterium]